MPPIRGGGPRNVYTLQKLKSSGQEIIGTIMQALINLITILEAQILLMSKKG